MPVNETTYRLNMAMLKERHEQAAQGRLIRQLNSNKPNMLVVNVMSILKQIIAYGQSTEKMQPTVQNSAVVHEGAI